MNRKKLYYLFTISLLLFTPLVYAADWWDGIGVVYFSFSEKNTTPVDSWLNLNATYHESRSDILNPSYNQTGNGTPYSRRMNAGTGRVELDNAAVNVSNKSFSVSVWIYPLALTGANERGIFDNKIGSSSYQKLAMSNDSAGNYIQIQSRNGAGSVNNTKYKIGAINHTWTHIVFARNTTGNPATTEATLYINGVLVNRTMGWSMGLVNLTQRLRIGNDGGTLSPFNGSIDEFAFFNTTLNAAQVLDLYRTGIPMFKIRAKDVYDASVISNYSAFIEGIGTYESENNELVTRIIPNSTSLYNITISSTQNGGYFNKTYWNTSTTTTLNATLYQSTLNITAVNILNGTVLTVFNGSTPLQSFTTTNGTGVLYLKAGDYNLTISGNSGYSSQINPVTMEALTSVLFQANLSPLLTFRFIREKTNTGFNVTSHNITLYIYCPSNTTSQTVTSNTTIVPIGCQWSFMQVTVQNGANSYFRTLIPGYSETSINWYLVDLVFDTAVETILRLNDLTGQYYNGSITVNKFINNSNVDIIEQLWDLENKVTLYLLRDALYSLTINAPAGQSTRNLGYLVADTASDKTITLPVIEISPTVILGGLVNYAFNVNDTLNFLSYNDTSATTSNITFTVYNGTNSSKIIYQVSNTNVGSATFTYVPTSVEPTITCFTALIGAIPDPVTQCYSYLTPITVGNFSNYPPPEDKQITNILAILGMLALSLAIYAGSRSEALACFIATIAAFMFITWGWLDLGSPTLNTTWLIISGVITALAFYIEVDRK